MAKTPKAGQDPLRVVVANGDDDDDFVRRKVNIN